MSKIVDINNKSIEDFVSMLAWIATEAIKKEVEL